MLIAVSSLLLSHSVFSADAKFYMSDSANVLRKYEEGNRILNDLKPGGKYSSVPILELSSEEIERRNGHNGGGVFQDPITKKYSILLNKTLSPQQKAQVVSHELQHVRDEMEFDKFLDDNPDINKIGAFVIHGLKSSENKIEFISKKLSQGRFYNEGSFLSGNKGLLR